MSVSVSVIFSHVDSMVFSAWICVQYVKTRQNVALFIETHEELSRLYNNIQTHWAKVVRVCQVSSGLQITLRSDVGVYNCICVYVCLLAGD